MKTLTRNLWRIRTHTKFEEGSAQQAPKLKLEARKHNKKAQQEQQERERELSNKEMCIHLR